MKRWIAKAAAAPSIIAIPLASSAALSESTSASRTSWSWKATPNQWVVKPAIGQLCTFER